MTTKQRVAQILGLPVNDNWGIVDSQDNLYKAHYNTETGFNIATYGTVRGVTVDINAGTKIAEAFGYTPAAISDKIEFSHDNKLILTDEDGIMHTLSKDKINLRHGLEGLIIIVSKNNGVTHFASHKRLNITRSFWGDSPLFKDMYDMLGGPSSEQLFDVNSNYSPFCHIFLTVHPDLLHVSRGSIGKGFLVYMGVRKMWDTEPARSPYRLTTKDGQPLLAAGQTVEQWQNSPKPLAGWVDANPQLPELTTAFPTEAELQPGQPNKIWYLPNLSVDEANAFLRYGYYKPFNDNNLDQRLRLGEFVIAYNTETGQLLRIESTAYKWRRGMRNDEANILMRFYDLSSDARNYLTQKRTDDLTIFRKYYPALNMWAIEDIKNLIDTSQLLMWPGSDSEDEDKTRAQDIDTFEKRLYNIWAAYLMAVPIHRQKQVKEYYEQYFTNFEDVQQWLFDLYQEGMTNREDSIIDYNMRIAPIISEATRGAQSKISQHKEGAAKDFQQEFKHSLHHILAKEPGSSMYRLMVNRKRIMREEAKKAEVAVGEEE